MLKQSRAHFAGHCAICHVNDGSGKTPIGKNVYPKAPDLRLSDTQSLSDGELFWVIHNGIRFTAMPAWGDSPPENDQDSWLLVHFIRHLPQITQEELDEMKSLDLSTIVSSQRHSDRRTTHAGSVRRHAVPAALHQRGDFAVLSGEWVPARIRDIYETG